MLALRNCRYISNKSNSGNGLKNVSMTLTPLSTDFSGSKTASVRQGKRKPLEMSVCYKEQSSVCTRCSEWTQKPQEKAGTQIWSLHKHFNWFEMIWIMLHLTIIGNMMKHVSQHVTCPCLSSSNLKSLSFSSCRFCSSAAFWSSSWQWTPCRCVTLQVPRAALLELLLGFLLCLWHRFSKAYLLLWLLLFCLNNAPTFESPIWVMIVTWRIHQLSGGSAETTYELFSWELKGTWSR